MSAVKLLCLFLCLLCNAFAFRPLRVCYDESKTLPRSSHGYSSIQDDTLFTAVASLGALVNTTPAFDLQIFTPQPPQGNILYPHIRVQSNSYQVLPPISSTFTLVESTRFDPKGPGMAGSIITSFPINYETTTLYANFPLFLTFGLNLLHNDTPFGAREYSTALTAGDLRSANTPIIDPVHNFGTFRAGMYMFGGFLLANKTRYYSNAVTWYNTRDYTGLSPPATGMISTFNISGTPPSPRASYGALPLFYASRFYALYFGGENGTHYFNDLFQLDITPAPSTQPQTLSWTRRNALPDPVFGLPSPRVGFAMNYARERDTNFNPRDFYIFGGENGTHYFNDFWKYYYDTNRWVRLDDENFRTTIPARAWHKGVSFFNGSYSNGNYLVYFGGKLADGSPAMFAAVELFNNSDASRCPYLCSNVTSNTSAGIPDVCTKYTNTAPLTSSMSASCLPYDDCMASIACPPSTTIQCGLQCLPTDALLSDYRSLSWCALQRPPCPTGKVPCWNGRCVDSTEDCLVFPACPMNHRRCDGGSCVKVEGASPASTCSAAPCAAGLEMCFDGACRAPGLCPRSAGCIPSDKNFQCPNGNCVADSNDCFTSSQCEGKVQCWDETCDGLANCSVPNWIQPLRQLNPSVDQDGYFLLEVEPLRNNVDFNKIAFPYYGLIQKPAAVTFQVKYTPQSLISSIGPEPTWKKEFDPVYITSAVPTITVTGVRPDNNVSILLRHQPNLKYSTVPSGNVIDRSKYCLAKAVPWYWDNADLSNSSLSNVSYISSYLAWNVSNTNTNATNTPVPDFGQPKLRWKCMVAGYPNLNGSVGNRWPNSYEFTAMFPDRMAGIVILEDLANTPVAIIRWVGAPIITPEGTQPAATNFEAHYIIDGVIGVTFVVLIVVVIFKACCARNT